MLKKMFLALITMSQCLFAELDIRIPVVDMKDYYNPEKQEQFLETIYQAMSEIGFFAVRNTGIDNHLIKRAYDQAQAFFKSDPSVKNESFIKALNGQRGFVPGETAKGENVKDYKEFYHIGPESFSRVPNVWPAQQGFKETMLSLYQELEKYSIPLQEAVILSINRKTPHQIPTDLLHQMTKGGESLLRALYYPALSEEMITHRTTPLFWAAAHTDINLITIFPFATAQGLQLQLKGEWLNVSVPDDAFVVNVGDMLENLTNGLFTSCRHRVLAQSPYQDRFSMVFFVHPFAKAALDPLEACIELTGGVQTYAPGKQHEFLWERLLELDIAPALLEPYSKTGHTERQIQFGRESPQVVEKLIEHGLASEAVVNFRENLGVGS